MRAASEGSLPPVMPQGNLVDVLGREVRQGSPGGLMEESSPSRQRRPPCKTNKEKSDEAADAAALTYLLKLKHTPHKPKPGFAGRSENLYQNTHTLDPSKEWRGRRKTQSQTQVPHNSRKTGVHSPGTEAARAMHVTRQNVTQRPWVRLPPKASAAAGMPWKRENVREAPWSSQIGPCNDLQEVLSLSS